MFAKIKLLWLQRRWSSDLPAAATDDLVSHLFEVAKRQSRLMEDDEVEAAVNQFLSAA